ncbi:MAG: Mpo1-like protein [Sandaracinobacter sp.]
MTTNQPPIPQSFTEFWPYYMAAHQDQRNRAVHYLGSVGGIAALLGALVSGNLWLLLVGILFGYACAWFGHFSFEHNKPATWVKPWWSFLGDWRMFWMKLTGREGEAVALGQGLPDIVEMVRARR